MTKIIAHRGWQRRAPENTIPAFLDALEVADGIELDVQLAACGTPVVAHDDELSRIYGRDSRVEQLTADQLARLRPTDSYDADPDRLYVPTLREVLALIPTECLLNIEIKAPKVRRVTPTRAIAELLEETEHEPLVSSFNPLELLRIGYQRRRTRLGLIYSPEESYLLREGLAAGPLGFLNLEALHPNWKLVSPDLLERAHERGWKVNVWTVNDPSRALWLREEGVDGFITDRPEELREHLG